MSFSATCYFHTPKASNNPPQKKQKQKQKPKKKKKERKKLQNLMEIVRGREKLVKISKLPVGKCWGGGGMLLLVMRVVALPQIRDANHHGQHFL